MSNPDMKFCPERGISRRPVGIMKGLSVEGSMSESTALFDCIVIDVFRRLTEHCPVCGWFESPGEA